MLDGFTVVYRYALPFQTKYDFVPAYVAASDAVHGGRVGCGVTEAVADIGAQDVEMCAGDSVACDADDGQRRVFRLFPTGANHYPTVGLSSVCLHANLCRCLFRCICAVIQ